MFKHIFSTMHEVLDEIIQQYPTAPESKMPEIYEKMEVLKAMSDAMIEEWLLFEEKLGKTLHSLTQHQSALALSSGDQSEAFQKGQGYYQLWMFDRAVRELQKVVQKEPDFLPARLYLALAYMQLGEFAEAHRHFQFLLPLTEQKQMKAISYNAMGCIQIQNKNIEKAQEYFTLAFKTDPVNFPFP